MFDYSEDSRKLILSMNNLNIFTTLLIYYKKGFIMCIPHSCVCVTARLFWNNPKDHMLMCFDYTAVFNSLLFTYIHSFTYNKDYYISPLLSCVFYTYFFSMHFKNINQEKFSIYAHTLTYLIGNIGTILTFS